jgi:hypothetical protein
VDFVELLGLSVAQLHAALGHDAQTGLFDDGVDLAGQVATRGVRLDDREGAFGHDPKISQRKFVDWEVAGL